VKDEIDERLKTGGIVSYYSLSGPWSGTGHGKTYIRRKDLQVAIPAQKPAGPTRLKKFSIVFCSKAGERNGTGVSGMGPLLA